MAGGQASRTCRAGPAVGVAVLSLALGATAGSQVPGLTSPVLAGDALARIPTPASSPPGMPAASLADIVHPADPPVATPAPTIVPRAWSDPGRVVVPTAARIELGICDTITQSVFGDPGPDLWRPLPFRTFFGEGWSEAWVPAPRGSGGAPRQGWINAVTGHLTRGWFFTFAYGANAPPEGDAYLGSYTLMAPLSRRLMLVTNVPFVLRNNAESGQPIIDPPGPAVAMSQSRSGFGDVSFTPRVLLHETKDFSLTAEFSVLTPTGDQPLAGNTAVLTPAVGFWDNFAGSWVIRGGLGVAIPTIGGRNNLIGQLAIGQTLTDHDLPLFGDFTCYLSAVVNTPLDNSDQTSVTLTPGLRTHVGRDWYLLAGLPTPVTKARVADLGMIVWFVKAW